MPNIFGYANIFVKLWSLSKNTFCRPVAACIWVECMAQPLIVNLGSRSIPLFKPQIMAADYLRLDQIGQFQDAFMMFATADGQVIRNDCEFSPEQGDEQGGGPHHEVVRAESL